MHYLLYGRKRRRLRKSALKKELPALVQKHFLAPVPKTWIPADQARFVVFDCEMTGLGEQDRLLSIGALRIENSRINLGDSYYEIINPQMAIPSETILIHNIMPDMTEGCPDSSEAIPRFLDFLGTDILVAHNARFDRDFVNREMTRLYGLPLASPIIDVMLLSRTNSYLRKKYRIEGALERHSLDALAAAYGIVIEDRHTAFGDAIATGMIFLRIMKALQRFGIFRVKQLLKAGGI